MHATLRQQKAEMAEDRMWLEKEEKLLVGKRASFTFVNPISFSLYPPAPEINVALEAELTDPTLNNRNQVARSRRPASLILNVPLITVPKRGSTSICYKMNLPVLLQDPMGPEGVPSPVVGDLFWSCLPLAWAADCVSTSYFLTSHTLCLSNLFSFFFLFSLQKTTYRMASAQRNHK